MSVSWQKLRYGTLAAATLAIAGTLIYDSDRRQVKPQDVIELVEALQERGRAINATNWWIDSLAAGVSTQQVHDWSVTAIPYLTPGGTNFFLQYDGTQDLVLTNEAVVMAFIQEHCIHTGRLVWAGWSNLTATTFGNDAVTGQYTLAGYNLRDTTVSASDGTIGYYTNRARLGSNEWVLLDLQNRGPLLGFQSAEGWMIQQGVVTATITTNSGVVATNMNGPWDWGFFLYEDLGGTYYTTDGWHDSFRTTNQWLISTGGRTGDVASTGALTTNAIRDGVAVYCETRPNVIRWQKPSAAFWSAFDLALTNLVISYVDYFDLTNGAVFHTCTNLFDRLNIGDGTNRFVKTVTNGVPVYGAVGRQLAKTNLLERYAVLRVLTQTVEEVEWTSTVYTNAWTNDVPINISRIGSVYIDIPTTIGPASHTAKDFVPEPIYDSWITNAAGTLVPVGWIPATASVSFPWYNQFYFNNATSRVFDGSIYGPVVVTTNTSSPRFEYRWRYKYDMNTYVVWAPGTTIGHLNRIHTWYQNTAFDHADMSSNDIRSSTPMVIFAADLTGLTYSIDYWLRDEDRTNVYASTYFQTGLWYIVETEDFIWGDEPVKSNIGARFQYPNMVVASNIGVGSSNLTRSTNFPHPWSVGRWDASVASDTGHLTNDLWYGRRVNSNKAIIKWNFIYATP